MWSVEKPQSKDHSFSFLVRSEGTELRARLTYDLLSNEENRRTLLLVTKPQTLSLSQALGSSNVELLQLEEELRSHEQLGKGAINRAKSAVNAIRDGRLPVKNITVAVHRFGPVPVYVVPEEPLSLTLFKNPRQCRVAIYPALRNDSNPRNLLTGTSNPAEYLASLNLRLDLMLKRYLEDAGEYCFDLEQHSTQRSRIDAAKKIEDVLGESINKKYRDIINPFPNHPQRARLLRLTREIIEANGYALIQARFARLLVLYCLNIVYAQLGHSSNEAEYLRELGGLSQSIDDIFGRNAYSDARSNLRSILEMEMAVEALRRRVQVEVPPPSEFENLLWLRRVLEFARFTALLRQQREKAAVSVSPLIFLSHHFEVGTSLAVKSFLRETLNQSRTRARLIEVHEKQVGEPFPEEIRTAIWLSNAVAPVIPAKTEKIGEDRRGGFRWIARELEHGILLKKKILPFVERGADTKPVEEACEDNEAFFLAPEARRGSDWRDEIRQVLNGRVVVMFGPPDTELETRVAYEAETLADDLVQSTILGLFGFFSDKVQTAIAYAQTTARYPSSRKELDRKISGFSDALEQTNKRCLRLNGEVYRLIESQRIRGVHHYKAGLGRMIRAIRPELSKDEVHAAAKKILAKWLLPEELEQLQFY